VLQVIVIFSLSLAGSLVGLSADLAHRFAARKARNECIVAGPGSARTAGRTTDAVSTADPVITFGSILACYGVLALALVCAIPAPLAMERTVLTFAFLCVGGLVGEISKSRGVQLEADPDAVDGPPAERKPPSRGLSLTLALVLNLAFAVLSAGQGLIDIVPASSAAPAPSAETSAHAQELQPIFVVAQRPESAQDERVGPAYQL
jgi:hypothetical protein